MEHHDAELVTRSLTGDHGAFEALIGRHQLRARAVAGAVLAGDQSAVDDVVQEAFVLAYRRLDDLGDPQRFAAWLRRIVHNQAVSWLRRHRKGRVVALGDHDVPDDGQGDATVQADDGDANPMLDKLRAALPKLRANYREILGLKYEAQLGYEAIADTLGISVANVEKRLYRARKRLLELIEHGDAER